MIGKKKVTDAECKLKQQENLLESVVSERNLYSKNLLESQVHSVISNIQFIGYCFAVYQSHLTMCCRKR